MIAHKLMLMKKVGTNCLIWESDIFLLIVINPCLTSSSLLQKLQL